MLKDKLNNLHLYEEGSINKFLRQIQKIQLELEGINQCVPEVDVVERLCNTLHPSYETIYNAFSGQDVLPTFETIVARLIQEETRISTHNTGSMLQPKQMPWR